MGMLLRLPKLIIEIKDKKRWSIDWVKVLVIGIPSIYIAMIRLLLLFMEIICYFSIEVMLLGDFTFTYIAGVIFGYVLLDSLKSNDSSNDKGKLA